LLKRTLLVDDSLDVSPVHGIGGVLGTTLTGLFVSERCGGVGCANGMTMASQAGTQAIGVLATAREGLDLAQHGESAYND
jgi:Amt family ammonium transporter